MKAVHAVRIRHPAIELSLRSIEFHCHRVGVRKCIFPVLKDHGHMQSVPRPPNAPLSIYESFQPFSGLYTAGVEPAQWLFVPVRHFQITDGLSPFCSYGKCLSVRDYLCEAVPVRLCLAYFLELVIVDSDLGILDRTGGQYVVYGDPYFPAVGGFGDYSYVRCHEIA